MLKNKPENLDELLEYWFVCEPPQISTAHGDLFTWAVANGDKGIVAYFLERDDAYRFRLDQINRAING